LNHIIGVLKYKDKFNIGRFNRKVAGGLRNDRKVKKVKRNELFFFQ